MENCVAIVAVSDLHGLLDGLEDFIEKEVPEILVIAGDIQPADISVYADQWFKEKFFPFIERLQCEVVATPGNHDFWLANKANDKSYRFPKNFHLLIDEGIQLCGLNFYGTPYVPVINGQWCFEAFESDLKKRFATIPENLDVLIAHSPPKGLNETELFDVSTQKVSLYLKHFGSMALREAILKKHPKWVICGHIHSGKHQMYMLGDKKCGTYVRNVSRVDERYCTAFRPFVFEMRKKS